MTLLDPGTLGSVVDSFASVLDQAAAFLLGHLWQATAFSTLVLLLVASLRAAPASLRYNLYLLASLKFLLPSALLLTLLSRWEGWGPLADWATPLGLLFDGDRLAVAVRSWLDLAQAESTAGPGASLPWLSIVAAIWLLGALALATRWMGRLGAFSRAVGRSRLVLNGAAFETLCRLRSRGSGRSVALRFSSEFAEPGVWGVWRPVIVLPEGMEEHLESEELESVLLHELVHVDRWDNLVSHLHMALCCLFWFHPMIWWIDRRLLEERERACDDRVVALLSGAPEAYARGLLKVLELGLGWRLAGVSRAAGADLRGRIERIREGRVRRAKIWHQGALGIALSLFLLSSLVVGAAPPVSQSRAVRAVTVKEAIRGVGSDTVASCLFPQAPPKKSGCNGTHAS